MNRGVRAQRPDRSQALTHPAAGRGPRDEGNGLRRDRRKALRIHHDRIEGWCGGTRGKDERLALRCKLLVAPRKHCHHDGKEIASLRGQDIFAPWWLFTVAAPLEQPGLCQMCEPPRQDIGRDSEAVLELVETRESLKGVAQDQNTPPLADAFKRFGGRAFGVGGFLGVHFDTYYPGYYRNASYTMLPAARAQSTTFSTRAAVSPLLRGCESRHFSKTTALNMLRLATDKEMGEDPCRGRSPHRPP